MVDVFTDQSRARPGGNKTSSFGFSTHTKLDGIAGERGKRLQAEATQDPGQEDTMSRARRAGPFPKDGATDVVMVFLVGCGEGKCEMAPPFPHQHYTTGSYDLLPWWANLIIKTWTNALAGRGRTLRRWDRVTMLFLPNKEKRHCRSEMFFTELGYFIA